MAHLYVVIASASAIALPIGLYLRRRYWLTKALFAALIEQGRREHEGTHYDQDIRVAAIEARVRRHLRAKHVWPLPSPRTLRGMVNDGTLSSR